MIYLKFTNKTKLIIVVIIVIIFIYTNETNKLPSLAYRYFLNDNCPRTKPVFCEYIISKSFSPYNITKQLLDPHFIKSHPNLPVYIYKLKDLPNLVPLLQSIRWSGIHWQESNKETPKFLLYSAHLDEYHCNNGFNQSLVYVLGLYDGTVEPKNFLCQFYIKETNKFFAVPVENYVLVDWQGFSPEYLVPYLLSCHLPHDKFLPYAVSIVKESCQVPTNLLQITGLEIIDETLRYNQYPTVGVCGPALYYYHEDFSARLVEWIEILNLIGVSKIILYKTVVHPNLEKVLNYYQEKNMINIISFHYPPPYVDEPEIRRLWSQIKRREMFALENIYFTDCILRFKNQFDYLAHFDPDEMPILKQHKTLGELMVYLRTQESSTAASFQLRWQVFYGDLRQPKYTSSIPESFYMLRHPNRISEIIKSVDNNTKSIYDTHQVRAAFSHSSVLYVNGEKEAEHYLVDPDVAYTAHFRSQKCDEMCDNVDLVEETFFRMISNKVIHRVNLTLAIIGIN